jgi:hypothetical protein
MALHKRRSSHQTQWAAQFAVASELCRRGYEVAFTTGNHPCVDLMVYSPNHVPFAVDVKGLYKKNFWPVRQQAVRNDLFYVLAFVPSGMPSRFFILTQAQVERGIQEDFERARSAAKKRGKTVAKNKFPGVSWKYAEAWENAWDSLPA